MHFKCFEEISTFEFPSLNLSLLSGSSGKGKSTIFNAIYWCLYGNMTKIKPRKSDNKKITGVLLELPETNGIYIKRCTPNNLEVGLNNGQLLIGDGAQGYIDNIFGNKNLWITSSYILQESKNPLLTFSNAEKFQLLHELTYGSGSELEENTPEYYLEKCDNNINDVKFKICTETGKFNSIRDVYTQKCISLDNIIKIWPTNTPLSELQNYINEKIKSQDLLKQYQKDYIIIRDIENKIEFVQKMLNDINEQLIKIPVYRNNLEIKNEIEQLEIEYHQFQEINKRYNIILDLQNKKKILNDIPNDFIEQISIIQRQILEIETFNINCNKENIKPENIIIEINRLENDCSLYLDELSKYLKYEEDIKFYKVNQSIIDEKWKKECDDIKNINNEIINYKKLKEFNTLQINNFQKIEKEYNDIKIKYDDIQLWWNQSHTNIELNIHNVENKINSSNMLLEELICPNCGIGVTYENKLLHKGHSSKEIRDKSKIDLLKYKEILLILGSYIKILIDYDKEKKYLESLICLPTEPKSLDIIELPLKPQSLIYPINVPYPRQNQENRLNKLKSLNDSKCLGDINLLKNKLIILQKGYELEKINAQLESLGVVENPKSINEISLNLSNKKLELNNSQNYENTKDLLNKRKIELELSLPKIPTYSSSKLQENIKILENNINIYTQYINSGETIKMLENEKFNIEQLYNQIINISKEENLLNNLKTLINEVSTTSLEETVKAINSSVNLILNEMFDDPITVIIATHKELKSKEKIKLQVNLQIHYQGAVCDNLNELSVGEGKRISLALTLAIARVSGSPILLLDEPMAMLNDELREKCIDVIKLYLSNKTIIISEHESVTGRFDHHIKI